MDSKFSSFSELISKCKLEECCKFIDMIFENTNFSILFMDIHFKLKAINPYFISSVNGENSHLIGKNFFDLYPNDKIQESFRKIIKKGIPCFLKSKPLGFSKSSEMTLIWDWNILPIKNQEGKVEYIILLLQNVSNQNVEGRKLTELKEIYNIEKTTLNNIIDLNPYAIAVFDSSGHNIKRNQAFINFFKSVPPSEYSIFEDPILTNAGYDKELSKAKNGEIVTIPELWYDPHKVYPEYPQSKKCFQMVIFPIFDRKNEIKNYVIMIEDFTERKLAEISLRKSEKKYREAYNLANLLRDLFIHDVNNILQNIISSINYYSEFRDDLERLKKLGEITKLIIYHANKGKRLISNIEKTTRIEDFSITLKQIKVSKILNNAVEIILEEFQNKDIHIKIHGLTKEMIVNADEFLIDIFLNILNNAVKFSKNKDEIFIEIKVSEVREDLKEFLKFEFIDFGIGIPDEIKKNIFKRLYRDTLSKRGMGIGLSLVKQIIDNYGGKIWIEDRVKGEYNKGSNFVVLLKI